MNYFQPAPQVVETDIFAQLKEYCFLDVSLDILVNFCNEQQFDSGIEPNIPRSMLERREELEVRWKKCGDVRVTPRLWRAQPPPSAPLAAAVADVVYNVGAFERCPVHEWNERGLYRLLFRTASWSKGSESEVSRLRVSACRALAAGAATHKAVRASLANTKDCFLALLATLKPFENKQISTENLSAQAQALMLVGALLSNKAASDTLRRVLLETHSSAFFSTLFQALESDVIELQDAALHCLTQYAQCLMGKNSSEDEKHLDFFENLKCSFAEDASGRRGAADPPECQPEYMAELLMKLLIELFRKLSADTKILSHSDSRWQRVCVCVSSVMAASGRCREYGAHRQLPRALLAALAHTRDRLALAGTSDAVKNAAQNPTLVTLHWLLTMIDCHMVECCPVKEVFAEEGLAASLCRLWPWTMLAAHTRESVMHLLVTFTNGCAKAWNVMCSCVGGRSLAGEVCALASREASLHAYPRPNDTLLQLALRTLTHIVPNHHCTTIILKSEVVTNVYRARVRERRGWAPAPATRWARLCEALARSHEGAGALLALRPLLAAPAVRAVLMPALAHLAHHRRTAVLQAPDLLELLSGTLLAGSMEEVISATRAVWALAANNHKAKLLLRSAGVAAGVQSALQRARRSPHDAAAQRALQLLLYTNTILQTT